MSFVYEVTAQMSEFVPGTGGFPLGGTGANVSAVGEDRVVRIFSDDGNITIAVESGVTVYDPVRGEFVTPGFTGVGAYLDTGGGVIGRFITLEVAFDQADPVNGERIAYELEIAGQPFLNFPETRGVQAVDQIALALGIGGVGPGGIDPYLPNATVSLDGIAGTLLGETGVGISEERAQNLALLYETGLDRDGEIDGPGLNFWIDAAEGGFSDTEISGFFTRAPEFEARFGPLDALSDAAYVDLLYQNTLERAGDVEGVAFWNGRLDAGLSREELLFAFATSVENADTLRFVETLTEIGPSDWAFVA